MPLITSVMHHFCWQIKVVPDQRPLTLGVIRHLSRGFKAQHLLLVSQQVYLFRVIDSACDQLPENLMTLSEDLILLFFCFFLACSLTQMSYVADGRATTLWTRGTNWKYCEYHASYLTSPSLLLLSFEHSLFTHKHFVWFPVINTEYAIQDRCDNLIM